MGEAISCSNTIIFGMNIYCFNFSQRAPFTALCIAIDPLTMVLCDVIGIVKDTYRSTYN